MEPVLTDDGAKMMMRKSLITLPVLLTAAMACTNTYATTFCGTDQLDEGGSCLVIKTTDSEAITNISLKKTLDFDLTGPAEAPGPDDTGISATSTELSYLNDLGSDFYYNDEHYQITHLGIKMTSAFVGHSDKEIPLSNCQFNFNQSQLNAFQETDSNGLPISKQFGLHYALGSTGQLTCKAESPTVNTKCTHDVTISSLARSFLGGEDADADFDPEWGGACLYVQNDTNKEIFDGAGGFSLTGNVTYNAITVSADVPNTYSLEVLDILSEEVDFSGHLKMSYALQSADGKPVTGCTLDLSTTQQQQAMTGKVIIFNVTRQGDDYICEKTVKNAPGAVSINKKKLAKALVSRIPSKRHATFSLVNKFLK